MDDEKPLRLITDPDSPGSQGSIHPMTQVTTSGRWGSAECLALPAGPNGAPGSSNEVAHRPADRMGGVGGDYPGSPLVPGA